MRPTEIDGLNMDNVTEKLFECFGHRKFKSELQERAVRAIARGKFII